MRPKDGGGGVKKPDPGPWERLDSKQPLKGHPSFHQEWETEYCKECSFPEIQYFQEKT
jgi:hypothetical protein